MAFRNWFTKAAGKTAETVISQAKEAVENHVATNGNAWFTLGKLALLGLIFFVTIKEAGDNNDASSNSQPTSIVINNYMERKDPDD